MLRALAKRPYLLLSFAALLWAGNAIAGKLAAGHISPFMLTSLRWLVALAVLLPLARHHLRRDWPLIRDNILFLSVLGTVGFTFFNNLLYLALNFTSAINVAIEQASMPLFVFLFNFLVFGQHPRSLQVAGFVLTLAGVAITVSAGQAANILALSFNLGDLLMIVAVMFYGAYSVALARKPPLHWLSFITVLALVALIASIPFTLFEVATGRHQAPDLQGWAVVLFAALLPAIMAQVSWVRGLEIIGSNRGGVFINLVPIFTAILAVLLLGEQFRLFHAIAMVLVLSGVWLAQIDTRRVSGAGR
jgi:drug/metabolite transporter (DMT)-like permease